MIPLAIQLYIPLDLDIKYKKFIAFFLGGLIHRPKRVTFDDAGFVMEFSLKNDKQVSSKTQWVTKRYQWWFMSAHFVADSAIAKKAMSKENQKLLAESYAKPN